MNSPDLSRFLGEIADCRVCRDIPRYGTPLPHEPRPVLQLSATARLLLSGQAPGTRVHASGRPFTDPSGDRLRQWLGLDEARFYNPDLLAIVPMGFCFPGLDAKGGDLPPRKECRETWHDRLFASRRPFDLTLLIGRYARDHHLPELKRESLTATVERFGLNPGRIATDPVIVLPHPSWRNTAWLKRHPWFNAEMVPALQRRVASLLNPA
ncbi:MAG: uracil-DNA glycosylase family protein [Pseudomonadota bacterium]